MEGLNTFLAPKGGLIGEERLLRTVGVSWFRIKKVAVQSTSVSPTVLQALQARSKWDCSCSDKVVGIHCFKTILT